VRKLLICAAALSGFAAQANAADLASVKDPLPDKLEFHGVTVFGTIDVGYGYQTHGLPASGANYNGLPWQLNRISDGSQSSIVNNALEQSKIGVKIEEQIGLGFTAIGKLETGFNPISGEIADACESLVRAYGYAHDGTIVAGVGKKASVDTFGDGSRCGQAFNGPAYGGLSNPLYGTLTIGRQNSLLTDGVGTYDPLAGSYAFSLLGSGTPLSGIGATETSRWNNSVKYIFTFGPVHAAGMYSNGGQDTPIMGDAYGANLGFTYKGFVVDGYYTKESGAVALSANPLASATDAQFGALRGAVTDNEAWSVLGKYTFEFGGGFKDDEPASKLTVFAGYNRTEITNPDHFQDYYNGFTTIGGYQLSMTTTASINALGSKKILDTEFGGATYKTGPWSFTGAYYHMGQNNYTAVNQLTGATSGCTHTTNTTKTVGGVTVNTKDNASSNCAGDIDMGSFVVDYAFNKHFDIYAGVSIFDVSGGLGSGYLQTENVNFASGLRLKF
jgi:predicted porin